MAHRTRRVGPQSWQSFYFIAQRWFKFHKLILVPEPLLGPIQRICDDFELFMTEQRGMTRGSIRGYLLRTRYFLEWVFTFPESLSAISIRDVDNYLAILRSKGVRLRTIASYCVSLRLFFRYGEMRGWSQTGVFRGIRTPRLPRYDPLPKGPPWKLVRQLLDVPVSRKPWDLRGSVVLFLCAIYGLRSSEIVRLTLDDFDWINETFIVRRSKHGRVQQYPIQFEVGEAILRYLKFGRPRASCRNLLLSLQPPFRPLASQVLREVLVNRVNRLGLDLKTIGTHSFRHACATELLRKGSSLTEIADFLGHRSLECVSIYAKHDTRSLRKVADFRLVGVR